MIKVELHNYELFALDYVEGRLVGDDLSAFLKFLEKHPEIKDEIDSLNPEMIGFESNAEFDLKTVLKKEALLSENINSDNYQTYFVAFHEGDLSAQTQEKVIEFVKQHPEKSREFESFSILKFKPDETIHFPLKRQIKKTTPIITLFKGLRVAASVAIILGIAWYFSQLNKDEQQYTERIKATELKAIPELENEQITESTSNDLVQQLKNDAIAINEINKQANNLPVQKEIQAEEQSPIVREELLSITSTTIQSATINQQFNADLKNKPIQEQVELAAEDENIFKIKLPKLFRQNDKEASKDESTTLARAKIRFKKKDKDPDQKTYVDLGPFKVYKKKGVTANASNLNESKDGL